MIAGAFVWPRGIVGMIEASTTRKDLLLAVGRTRFEQPHPEIGIFGEAASQHAPGRSRPGNHVVVHGICRRFAVYHEGESSGGDIT